MDFKTILSPEIQAYVQLHSDADVRQLALQKNPFPGVDFKRILGQIEARVKSKEKLPTWFISSDIIFPNKLSIEQTSSEITAQYKSELIQGKSLIDLTGGFGVDDYYFAQKINVVVHCELQPELSEIVKHNFSQLDCKNITCYSGDSKEILQKLQQKFDWMYIDPSRRNDAKGKVFMLKDCLPDVPNLLDFYFEFCDNILIKTAPLLDLTAGLSELKKVKEIHIVAVENEVKELLWLLDKNHEQHHTITTINIAKKGRQTLVFSAPQESFCNYNLPQKYLYEPNAAIMKSGAFEAVATLFNLAKLNRNTHLYTSDRLIEFPGRVFEVKQVIDYSKK